MVHEVLESLHIDSKSHFDNQARYIDATVGAGGHTLEIAKRGGLVLGLDADPKMLEIAKKNLEDNHLPAQSFRLRLGNFRDIGVIAQKEGFVDVDGILFDLGVSSIHFLEDNRGFSFKDKEASLDMRLNQASQGLKAADLVNTLRGDQLTALFAHTMPYKFAKALADKVVVARKEAPIETVGEFLKAGGFPEKKPGELHPATTAFLALRMAVNTEIPNVEEALPKALDLLRTGGRLAVITFHSGEDHVVKKLFEEFERNRVGKVITKDPILPGSAELERNPKARSAKLRVVERL